jgi:hypothetical protein
MLFHSQQNENSKKKKIQKKQKFFWTIKKEKINSDLQLRENDLLTPPGRPDFVKLFTAVICRFRNKLECLSLASLSSLV